MKTKTEAGRDAVAGQVERPVRPASEAPGQFEAEVLRNLANHARFEAAMMNACDGSMSAQKAACLEWLACGAEYQQMLRGGPHFDARKLLEAERNLVSQIKFLGA